MQTPDFSDIKALYINCTLKKSPSMSHTRNLIDLSENIMRREGVETEIIRFIDHKIASGVYPDMTEHGWETDEWQEIYKKIMQSDILIIGTPIWLGERSSEATKLIERLYSMSSKMNDKGQYIYYGKAGGCIVTGNEDGVKHCSQGILYALQHIGYTIPPQADCGWLGEIGPGPSYGDEEVGYDSEFTNKNTTIMTYNLLHLATILNNNGGYPAYGNSAKEWEEGERWNFTHPTDLHKK